MHVKLYQLCLDLVLSYKLALNIATLMVHKRHIGSLTFIPCGLRFHGYMGDSCSRVSHVLEQNNYRVGQTSGIWHEELTIVVEVNRNRIIPYIWIWISG